MKVIFTQCNYVMYLGGYVQDMDAKDSCEVERLHHQLARMALAQKHQAKAMDLVASMIHLLNFFQRRSLKIFPHHYAVRLLPSRSKWTFNIYNMVNLNQHNIGTLHYITCSEHHTQRAKPLKTFLYSCKTRIHCSLVPALQYASHQWLLFEKKYFTYTSMVL